MCGAHAAVRTLVGELVGSHDRPTVLDIEAGLEHLSRGTARHVDTILIIAEPYFKSMETAARMNELARELGIGRVFVVANKIRTPADEAALREFFAARGVEVGAVVPDDETVLRADRQGVAPLDVDADAPSMRVIANLASELRSRA